MFDDRYGLTQEVLELLKDMTRRIIPEMRGREYKKKPDIVWDANDECFLVFNDKDDIEPILLYPKYKIGEVLAVAQNYKKCWEIYQKRWEEHGDPSNWRTPDAILGDSVAETEGWTNKMFVKADLMPHHIRITNISVERLRDISDEDCLREGVKQLNCGLFTVGDYALKVGRGFNRTSIFRTPRKAYAALIDKISGKGTWDENPYVYVYEFELLN